MTENRMLNIESEHQYPLLMLIALATRLAYAEEKKGKKYIRLIHITCG